MKTKFTDVQLKEIKEYQEKSGVSRKTAIRHLFKTKAPKLAPVDSKSAAANDKPDGAGDVRKGSAPKLPAKNASLVAKGAAYHVLAGRPSKDAVVACFGKSGYALSWVSRAEKLGVTPQELCERFAANAAELKKSWAALEAK